MIELYFLFTRVVFSIKNYFEKKYDLMEQLVLVLIDVYVFSEIINKYKMETS